MSYGSEPLSSVCNEADPPQHAELGVPACEPRTLKFVECFHDNWGGGGLDYFRMLSQDYNFACGSVWV
jgi:hypothetical protein